ncbi:aspartate 1-decarboxylase autocleavage activator PanM [Enterobacteriaceae bacterium BIT-l23]|uniref:PanD regulatory factor n=1 Tax=Jejubacter calystegiae TaxID=2579935 RepID=A0A4P8YGP7_9ENTR|nr:aspartate 1-decarboxylase autocleavage activator PanM [Jejubacter calystegiae]NUU65704.1 aspartate 1-decarboxylase autocleavage activator PanM [Enterobacteriaceae bacterium BIT-l23]QCT18858.1 aspartate 1-decarboxylase autocleavage activator PanM [Jejubacter calystegiae]
MKLTIVRLTALSPQDKIDLEKIWPEYAPADLTLDESHRLYAARFNERLLGALRVTCNGTHGELDSLRVRELTRRRGVGKYLLEEAMRDNPQVSDWRMSAQGVEDNAVMTAFMLAMGFQAEADGWRR